MMWTKAKQGVLDSLLKEKEQHDNLVQQIDHIFAKITDSIHAGACFSIEVRPAEGYYSCSTVRPPTVYEITLYE